MTQVMKLVTACQKVAPGGVETETLAKIMKGSHQSVHTAACTARKRGVRVDYKKGKYYVYGSKEPQSKKFTTSSSLRNTLKGLNNFEIAGVNITQTTLNSFDEKSRDDLIEQLKRAKLHLDIARSIMNSNTFAAEMRKK